MDGVYKGESMKIPSINGRSKPSTPQLAPHRLATPSHHEHLEPGTGQVRPGASLCTTNTINDDYV